MTSFYAAFNGGTASTSEQNNFATVSTRNRSASGQLIDNNNSNWDLPYQKAYPTTYQSDVWKLVLVSEPPFTLNKTLLLCLDAGEAVVNVCY